MNKRNQYTVMVETKEIRKFCVVASSVEEAAELMCNVAANTDFADRFIGGQRGVYRNCSLWQKRK